MHYIDKSSKFLRTSTQFLKVFLPKKQAQANIARPIRPHLTQPNQGQHLASVVTASEMSVADAITIWSRRKILMYHLCFMTLAFLMVCKHGINPWRSSRMCTLSKGPRTPITKAQALDDDRPFTGRPLFLS